VWDYRIEANKNVITVYTTEGDARLVQEFRELAPEMSEARIASILVRSLPLTAVLQFVLVDEARRRFVAQRYCYLGSIDDWIDIGREDTLPNLVAKYVKHLGKDTYYDLGLPE